jgi:hypothetical protein
MGSKLSIDMALESKNPGKLLHWKPNLNNTNQIFKIHSPGIAGSAIQLLCAENPNLAIMEYENGELWMKNELTNNGAANRYIAPVVIFMLRYITPLLIFYIFIMNLL